MTTIHRYVSVPGTLDAAWNWISEVTNWDMVADAFVGKEDSFRHKLEFETAPRGQKMRVIMSDPYGKKRMVWSITEWKPREEITMQTEHEGFWSGFRAVETFKMETLITSQTRMHLILELQFSNWLITALAFFLPMQWMYGRRLDRALQSIRSAVR